MKREQKAVKVTPWFDMKVNDGCLSFGKKVTNWYCQSLLSTYWKNWKREKKTKRKTTATTTNKKAGSVFRLKLFFIFDLYIPIGWACTNYSSDRIATELIEVSVRSAQWSRYGTTYICFIYFVCHGQPAQSNKRKQNKEKTSGRKVSNKVI